LNRLYTSLKDALDPAGTLSPGNHGIWPSSAKNF
jgi:4-cresol dehydrogenase (hydroxylating)